MQFLWRKAGRKLCRNCVKIGGSAALRQAEFSAFAQAPTTRGTIPPKSAVYYYLPPFFSGKKSVIRLGFMRLGCVLNSMLVSAASCMPGNSKSPRV